MKEIWAKIKWGKTLQIARICKFSIGRYGFETKQFDEFEKNINMPMFETQEEAIDWINNNKEWGLYNETK